MATPSSGPRQRSIATGAVSEAPQVLATAAVSQKPGVAATVAVPQTPQEPATVVVPKTPQPPATALVVPQVPVTGPITGTEAQTMTLPFPLSPAQPGQVQVKLQVGAPNSKVPSLVKFTANIQDTGDTDLSNLGVWFLPFEGAQWTNVATGVMLRRKTQANISFDYAFAQPGTYAPVVVIQGVEGAPSAMIQIEVPGAVQETVSPGNPGSKGKNNGNGKGNGNNQ